MNSVIGGNFSNHARIAVRLDREGEPPARCQHPGDARGDRREIAAIDEDIGREREMVLRPRLSLGEFIEVGNDKAVVQPFGPRLLDHAGRNVDAHKPIAIRPERRAAQAGAAAEIEHRAEPEMLAARRPQRREQKLRPAIVEALHQRLVEIRRVLIEQPPHIDAGHRRCRLAGAEPRQMQPRAVIILAVGVARRGKRGDGPVAIAHRLADRGEREPRGGKARRRFHHLRQDVGRRGRVAALKIIQRPLVAPVGDQIAG